MTTPHVQGHRLGDVALETQRLILRPWEPGDAASLCNALEENQEHLAGWIPSAISTAAPIAVLIERLDGFRADLDHGRRSRRAIVHRESGALLGGVDLFGRSDTERVPFAAASCGEVGYWLRRDATGQGFATEAVRGVLQDLTIPSAWTHIEIRCDRRNEPSRGVAQRLGFVLHERVASSAVAPPLPPIELEVWTCRWPITWPAEHPTAVHA